MFTHRTATPGATGANDGYGARRARSRSTRTSASTPTSRRTQTEGRTGDDLSYRGLFDYNADRYGVQVERLVVEPNFLPEIGFVRRTDMRRNFGLLRYSPRPTGDAAPAQAHDAGEPQLPDQQPEPPRHARARRPVPDRVHQQRRRQRHLHRHFERLVRPFAIAPGRPHSGRRLRLPHHAALAYIGGQQRKVSGAIVYETGTFYDGTRQSIAVNTARVQVTPQVSLEPSCLGQLGRSACRASFTAKVVRTRATYTITPRMFVSGIVQYNSTNDLGRQQPALPLGISARQRAVRRLHRRLQHRVRPCVDRSAQPRLCHQGESPVPTMTGTRRRSHSDRT